ncbi:hypothetical protein CFAM422_005638 [Trichoderma lentiforme]|uniref:Uncharacterized protein n=1 Tax=Trichoderma lentiforme TaxID=1567552 RepID=A0A9P4XHH3_9HYPO|nr:hypothetical protein CFAM422_005638 [Trichoderma lentiforme]
MILRDAASVPAPGRAPGAEHYGLSSEFFQGWSDLELRPLNQALFLVCCPRGQPGITMGLAFSRFHMGLDVRNDEVRCSFFADRRDALVMAAFFMT